MQSKILLACFLAAGCAARAATPTADAPATLELSWHVSLDNTGHAVDLGAVDARGEKVPQIRAALEPRIRSWQFTPGTLDGYPAATETTLQLSLAVWVEGSDRLHIRIDDARTGGRVAKYAIPHYPRSAVQSNSGGIVVTRAQYDASGKVTSVVLDEQTPRVGRDVQKAALDSVKQWVFEPEQVGGHGVAGEAWVPICFQVMHLAASMPPTTPQPACAWTPPGHRSPVAQGATLTTHPVASLVTDVVDSTP